MAQHDRGSRSFLATIGLVLLVIGGAGFVAYSLTPPNKAIGKASPPEERNVAVSWCPEKIRGRVLDRSIYRESDSEPNSTLICVYYPVGISAKDR